MKTLLGGKPFETEVTIEVTYWFRKNYTAPCYREEGFEKTCAKNVCGRTAFM